MNYETQGTSSEVEAPSQDIEKEARLEALQLIETTNIAEELDEDRLIAIGMDCKRGLEADLESRISWERDLDEWIKLAAQIREDKTFPWPGASNVKYPLISTASMQFSARAYPALVPGNGKLVKAEIVGKDPDGQKSERATRVSRYMDYQLLTEMDYWEEDMDKMLLSLGVLGMMFKKTYYDTVRSEICSKLVYPENLVVNYWADTLETAERTSEVMWMTKREVETRKRKGTFLDVDLGDPQMAERDMTSPASSVTDTTTPYCIIEQHCYIDIDEDDLPEPYIVTFHRQSGKVLRIVARFSEKDIDVDEDGTVIEIRPIEYYTKFGFIPNPDGSFYDLGFGHLLGPLNESVNTTINQLLDSGSLSILQAGFIGKGLRMKMGESPFKPGEWKVVNAVGDDIRKQLVPLPTAQPSPVLFELLGMLVQSGKELASVAEIFTGKMPGQNTPATTTMATIEQGMKVFTAIYKRVYRSLKKEFKKIYRLNSIYLEEDKYTNILDEPATLEDFDQETYDICPTADPTASSSSEKMLKAQALMEMLPLGTIDPIEVTKRMLEAQEQPNWEKLIPGMVETGQPQIPPKEDPKVQEMKMKMELEEGKFQMKQQESQQKMQLEQMSEQGKIAMAREKHQLDIQAQSTKNQLDAEAARHKTQADIIGSQQKLAVNQQMGEQKIAQAKESAKLANQKKSSSGSGKTTQSRKKSSKN